MSSEAENEQPDGLEADLARQWNAENERDALRARMIRGSFTFVLLATAIGLGLLSWYGWAFHVFGLAAFAFIMYLDANGHVHEIRERPDTRLARIIHAFQVWLAYVV